MAKARKVPADFEVELSLTREEALALRAVCMRIGGHSATTRRKHFDAIAKVLDELEVNEGEPKDISTTDRAIYFEAK